MAIKRKTKKKVQEGNLGHKNLTVFKQHGFKPLEEAGETQVLGNCIFCGSGRKPSFYVNVETKAWDCKRCNAQGGFQKFLQEVNHWCRENIDRKRWRELAESRTLEVSTLKAHEVGYNIVTGNYTLPIWDLQNENLRDLRIYNGKQLRSSAGCNVSLYGGHTLNLSAEGEIKKVWLVEGEWDKMAMWEILIKNGIENEIPVAVPGANTFKTEWLPLFASKTTGVIYDKDDDIEVNGKTRMGAGVAGAIKVYNMLRTVTDDMSFLHWPEKFKSGFDLRDFYIRKKNQAKRTYKALGKFMLPLPKRIEETDSITVVKSDSERFTGEGCDIKEVKDTFKKYLKLKPENKMIEIVLATVVANRKQEVDPLWLYLVGDSGSGKSEILMSLSGHTKEIHPISSLTPNTLISGANFSIENDPSLVPKLDRKMLIIKDLTTILGMNSTAQNEIFSQMRDAYDGECSKPYGNGVERKYKSKFGIIAGTTGVIDIHSEGMTALGERFIQYKIPIDKSLSGEHEVLMKVMGNVLGTNKSEMKEKLREKVAEFLDHDFKTKVTIPIDMQAKVGYLAQWTARLRGTVIRDLRHQEITNKPMIEYATRLSAEYVDLLEALSKIHRYEEPDEELFDMVRVVAKSTPPSNNIRLVNRMVRKGMHEVFSAKEMEEFIGTSSVHAKKVCGDLVALKVLYKKKLDKIDSSGNKAAYGFTREFKFLIKETGIYQHLIKE